MQYDFVLRAVSPLLAQRLLLCAALLADEDERGAALACSPAGLEYFTETQYLEVGEYVITRLTEKMEDYSARPREGSLAEIIHERARDDRLLYALGLASSEICHRLAGADEETGFPPLLEHVLHDLIKDDQTEPVYVLAWQLSALAEVIARAELAFGRLTTSLPVAYLTQMQTALRQLRETLAACPALDEPDTATPGASA
jgi:hypothetical protein